MRVVIPDDSGNAADVEVTAPDAVRFAVRADTSQPGAATSGFRQWFSLELHDLVPGRRVTATVVGASSTSYPKGWDGYRAVLAEDGERWVRIDTVRDGDDLVLSFVPAGDRVALAYFAPYPHARREAFVAELRRRGVDVRDLGPTPDGLALPLITFGAGASPVWIVARQHPGETMAEWFVEGLVRRLVDGDGAVQALLAAATVRIVPCVNPDGARRGNHRTNALGMDLNRAWAEPDARSPEVVAIRAEMDRTGVSFGLDVHGDEEIPYVFPTGARATPSWDAARNDRLDRFVAAWMANTPHLQTVHGYPPSAPGEANLSVCSNQLTERYRCVAITLEQPFLDHDDDPDPVTGWSPARSAALGASLVEALRAIVDRP